MKLKSILFVLCILPIASFAADRTDTSRVGAIGARPTTAAARAPTSINNFATTGAAAAAASGTTVNTVSVLSVQTKAPEKIIVDKITADKAMATIATTAVVSAPNCRDDYRNCMNEFCMLDESEGARCACSAAINQSKELIKEVQKIQSDADKLYTVGVEREKLGAKVNLVFGESESAKKSSRASGLSFSDWLNNGATTELGADADIGDDLYQMASGFCADKLKACGTTADMEESLYTRQIVSDCKNFNAYLTGQKSDAESNKKIAESAVRAARLSMLDTTNKYNRGECLLAFKSCVSDKGGCGSNFENCLDADLLTRRSRACDNVLDQCSAVKGYVASDWEEESKTILAEAAKYADKNRRLTCFAKIQLCLEDGCSTSTNSACLTNVSVAAGVCPIIDECNAIIPGIKNSVNDKLGFLRAGFCANDVDKCLQEQCGKNYTDPACLGKKTSEIKKLCPQNSFPSCNGESQFDIIVSSAMMQMDYQMLSGCLNYFGTELGKVCGTDMSCLPVDDLVASLKTVPETDAEIAALRAQVRENSAAATATFFTRFEKDTTIAACADAKKPAGRSSLRDSVFGSAKIVAEIGAENRSLRALESKIAELSRAGDIKQAEQNCLSQNKPEEKDSKLKNYSYIKSVSFEPALRNCHICRIQQVCEVGGESKATSGLKAAGGAAAAGAAAGTMVMPGWGTAIGGLVGGIGGFFGGSASGGKQEFCQEISSCEDVNY